MRYISVCSGIEAASLAFIPMKWEPVAFAEIDAHCCAVLKHYHPDVPNWGDLTKFKEWPDARAIDLVCGGTPCQAFSIAGLRKGLADPRGNLTLSFLGVVEKYKPKWVLWENVPGVLSDDTEAFGQFLSGLDELGYGLSWRVLDARYYGVPQRRRRVFVVGNLGNWRHSGEVLFEQKGEKWDPPQGTAPWKSSPRNAEAGAGAVACYDFLGSRGGGVEEGISPTLKKKDGVATVVPAQGVDLFNQALTGDEHCPLRTAGGHGAPAVAVQKPIAFNHQEAHCFRASTEHTNPLRVNQTEAVAVSVQISDSEARLSDVAAPLQCQKTSGVQTGAQMQAVPIGKDVAPTLGARDGKGPGSFRDGQLQGCVCVADVAPPLTESGPPFSRTGNERNEAEALVVAYRKRARARSTEDDETWEKAQVANTLNQFDVGERDTHAICVRTAQTSANGHGLADDEAHTLDGAQGQAVAIPIDASNACRHPDKKDAMNRQGCGIGADGDPSPPVTAAFSPAVAFKVRGGKPTYTKKDGKTGSAGKGYLGREDEAFTVSTVQDQHVCTPTLTSTNDPSRSPQSSEVTEQVSAVHEVTMQVRRLTPMEAERLQGMPDNYTLIPYKGKPMPDGPRYKMLGNSWAVPCVRWIAERIQRVENNAKRSRRKVR